jgi:probable HAF family extracellular repeat protein
MKTCSGNSPRRLALLAFALPVMASAQDLYVAIPLEPHDPGRQFRPWAINDVGTVAGHIEGDRGGIRGKAFAFDPRSGYTAFSLDRHNYNEARGVNNAGSIAGVAADGVGKSTRAFYRAPANAAIDLFADEPESYAEANGINSAGSVVGVHRSAKDANEQAFLWREGQVRWLGDLGGGRSAATAINDHETVVGYSTDAQGLRHGFVWQQGVMRALPALPGSSGELDAPRAINSSGVIVGECGEGTHTQACMWRDGVAVPLGKLTPDAIEGSALAVNDSGVAVGFSKINVSALQRAVLFAHGRIIALDKVTRRPDDIPWARYLQVPTGINEAGWISVIGVNGTSFVLEPVVGTGER